MMNMSSSQVYGTIHVMSVSQKSNDDLPNFNLSNLFTRSSTYSFETPVYVSKGMN